MLNYSTRKEFARSVNDAKSEGTRHRRIDKIITSINFSTD